MTRRLFATLAAVLLASPGAGQQTANDRLAWNQPFPPFRVIGNVHFVGAAGVSAFLITTPDGSILLDGGLPETVPQIVANIAALGFRVDDVRVLLNSHAHFDHAGGLAELKRLSGAAMVASRGDAPALTAGAGADMPPVTIDRMIDDGETVSLGGTTMTAHVTPGHTKGCTTWTLTTTEAGRAYRVLFYCSTSVVDRLVDNPTYPEIVSDYERTFARLRSMQADVFLANHPAFFAMERKRAAMRQGGPNPFVDPDEIQQYVEASARQFHDTLERQRR